MFLFYQFSTSIDRSILFSSPLLLRLFLTMADHFSNLFLNFLWLF